ncbi:MAG: hypothetical protein ACRDLP_07045 [Solirubrobacteraceae bacterium]
MSSGGSYVGVTVKALQTYEPTITIKKEGADGYVSKITGTATGYALTVTSVETGDKFTIKRGANGTLSRSCTIPKKASGHGGCEDVTKTKGTW